VEAGLQFTARTAADPSERKSWEPVHDHVQTFGTVRCHDQKIAIYRTSRLINGESSTFGSNPHTFKNPDSKREERIIAAACSAAPGAKGAVMPEPVPGINVELIRCFNEERNEVTSLELDIGASTINSTPAGRDKWAISTQAEFAGSNQLRILSISHGVYSVAINDTSPIDRRPGGEDPAFFLSRCEIPEFVKEWAKASPAKT